MKALIILIILFCPPLVFAQKVEWKPQRIGGDIVFLHKNCFVILRMHNLDATAYEDQGVCEVTHYWSSRFRKGKLVVSNTVEKKYKGRAKEGCVEKELLFEDSCPLRQLPKEVTDYFIFE